jgi:hypothetical protein
MRSGSLGPGRVPASSSLKKEGGPRQLWELQGCPTSSRERTAPLGSAQEQIDKPN